MKSFPIADMMARIMYIVRRSGTRLVAVSMVYVSFLKFGDVCRARIGVRRSRDSVCDLDGPLTSKYKLYNCPHSHLVPYLRSKNTMSS